MDRRRRETKFDKAEKAFGFALHIVKRTNLISMEVGKVGKSGRDGRRSRAVAESERAKEEASVY